MRLVSLVEYSQSSAWGQLTIDNWYHHNWAETIADGNVFGDTTYFRAPFYTLCLGGLYWLFGASLWTARLFGLTIGLASIIMTYLLAHRVSGPKLACVAAALQALFPAAIFFESELLLDPLFTLLTQLAVHRFLIWLESRQGKDIVQTGLWLGLAAITRPTILVAVPLVVIWMIARPRQQRSAATPTIGHIGLLLCSLAIIILPVSVRNLIRAGDPVLIASQGGINLYIGNNDASTGLSGTLPEPLGHNWTLRETRHIAETERGANLKPGEVSDYWRERAVAWIFSNPGSFLELFSKRLGYQLVDQELSNTRQLRDHFASISVLRYNPLSFGMVFPLALVGLIGMSRRSEAARFVAVLMLVYTLAMAVFFVNSRFRLPLLPYHFVFAGAGMVWVSEKVRGGRWRLLGATALAAVAGWFSFSPPMNEAQAQSSQHLMSQGLYLYDHGEYRQALSAFQRAASVDPTFPETNLSLGACFFRLGQEDSAKFYFDREIRLHPQRSKGYHNLASLNLVNGRIAEALRLSNRALALAPYSVPANTVKLRTLAADSMVTDDSLWRALESAAWATDEDLTVLNLGASLLSRNGCTQTVEKCLQRARASVPPPIETDDLAFHANFSHSRPAVNKERAKTYYLLGYCAGTKGQFEMAVEYSRRAIELDPQFAEAHINLYSGLLSTGRLVEADSLLAEVSHKFPENAQINQLRQR